MATIKDIARLAGVSQGTVSNVLNGKTNVSSTKIRLVEQAAAQLGYTVNERAKHLRKGSTQMVAILLPNITFRHYQDIYMSFKNCCEEQGFTVQLYLTGDDPNLEQKIIPQLRSALMEKVAAISCLPSSEPYLECGFAPEDLLFLERKTQGEGDWLGFDYARCGAEMAEHCRRSGYTRIGLLTGNLEYSNEKQMYRAFLDALPPQVQVTHLQTDGLRKSQSIFQLFRSVRAPECVYLSNYGFAETVKDICSSFYPRSGCRICTVSTLFTMPENDFVKYELNYRLLGRKAALRLTESRKKGVPGQEMLENRGFRHWFEPNLVPSVSPETLNILTLDSPEAEIMETLANLYTEKTGIRIKVSVFSYDELYSVLSNFSRYSIYDVIRLDVAWLSWFAGRILEPLTNIRPDAADSLKLYDPQLLQRYSFVNRTLYALPSTPSVQLLFYRKDLFESTVLKRMYQESFKEELRVPEDFRQFNQIAKFFTRAYNPSSPVQYGATLTTGGSGVACSEFLARFFCYHSSLLDEEGHPRITLPEGKVALQQLMELQQYAAPVSHWWKNTARIFAQGDTAMTILYSNYASDLFSHPSLVTDRVGCALLPGRSPVTGGGVLGVSRYSQNKEAALSFIRWMCSEPVSSAVTLLGGASACRQTYENYELIDAFPWLSLVEKSFSRMGKPAKVQNSVDLLDEHRLLRSIGAAVKEACAGAVAPDTALAIAKEEYEEFLRQHDR